MSNLTNLNIKKTLIHPGTKNIVVKDGTKVFFHFVTRLDEEPCTILDDSREMGKGRPMELVIGSKFRMEVWEVFLKRMSLNEVCSYKVPKSLVLEYPFVSKAIRGFYNIHPPDKKVHVCAMSMQTHGIGFDDLNSFMKKPCGLEFTMEIVKVEQPDEYQKYTFLMDEKERIARIPKLKEQGNEHFQKKDYEQAALCYATGIDLIEKLMTQEKPHDTEWNEWNEKKIPFLLNYAQCKLLQGEFYETIQTCSSVIQSDKKNVKAYFRRGKAHVGAWNPEEAKKDLEKVLELDSTLEGAVKKELLVLERLISEKNATDSGKYKKMFT